MVTRGAAAVDRFRSACRDAFFKSFILLILASLPSIAGQRPKRRLTGEFGRDGITLSYGCSLKRTAASTSPAKDRKSTRLNSSHVKSSYAVFCLKKKNNRLFK